MIYKIEAVDNLGDIGGEPVEERMLIGFFDSMTVCEEVQREYKQLPGFSLSTCRFEVTPYCLSIDETHKTQSVYFVQEWIFDDITGNEEITEIGLFKSFVEATNAKHQYLCGRYNGDFEPEEHSNCIYIDRYVVNERHWKEGFSRDFE